MIDWSRPHACISCITCIASLVGSLEEVLYSDIHCPCSECKCSDGILVRFYDTGAYRQYMHRTSSLMTKSPVVLSGRAHSLLAQDTLAPRVSSLSTVHISTSTTDSAHNAQNSSIRPHSPSCGHKVYNRTLVSTAALTSVLKTLAVSSSVIGRSP